MCWTLGDYQEGYVLYDSGGEVQVATKSGFPEIFTPAGRHKISRARWRETVSPGDLVELAFVDSWIPCKVRGVQRKKSRPTVLVIEPVFVGYCVSAPLDSLVLRKPSEIHPDLIVLQQSGFAFNDDYNKDCPDHWPAYSPHGCMNFRYLGECAHARLHVSGQTYYVLKGHPVLPPEIKMVRTQSGVLKFALDSELGCIDTNSKLRVPYRAHLGSLTVPYAESKPTVKRNDNTYNLFLDTAKLSRFYYDKQNTWQAAKCMGSTPSNVEWRGESRDLAEALLDSVLNTNSVPSCHPLIRVVWQHQYADLSHFGSGSDLHTLADSLEFDIDQASPGFDSLKNHLCIWQMYTPLWELSRKFQIAAESFKPVETTIESMDSNEMVFSVDVMVTGENPRGEKHNLGKVARILQAFTHPNPSLQAPSKNLFQHTADWNTDVWSYFGTSNQCSSTVQRMFERENCADVETLGRVVTHTAFSKVRNSAGFIKAVSWNPFEGPTSAQVFNGYEEYNATNPDWCTTSHMRGGVLVEQSSVEKMRTIADLILLDRSKTHLLHFGRTIIVTKPTLLSEWKSVLESRGVPAHLYHGRSRATSCTQRAIELNDIIVTTSFCVSNARDKWFLSRHLGGRNHPLKRIVLDGLMCRKTIPSSVFEAVHDFDPTTVWLLEREATKNIFGTALALLKVRPFYKRARWDTDICSEMSSRQYVHLLLLNKNQEKYTIKEVSEGGDPGAADNLRRLRHELVKRTFVCGEDSTTLPFFSMTRHGEAHMNTGMRCLLRRIAKAQSRRTLRRDCSETPSRRSLANLLTTVTGLYYGMKPDTNKHFSECVAVGNYDVDASSFLERMKLLAKTESDRKAIVDVEKLSKHNPIEGTCPVCMESLPNSLDTDKESLNADMNVVYGKCGHALCSCCADTIQRISRENRETQNNDYGLGDNSVNRPRCPVCRDPWDTGMPPLLATTNKHFELVSEGLGVWACPRDVADGMESPSATPGVRVLRRIVNQVSNSKNRNIVVMCQKPYLAEWLCDLANEGGATKAVVVSPQKSVLSRKNAVKCFRHEDNQIHQLYISANVCAGLAFSNTDNFVFADRMKHDFVVDALYMMLSSWKSRPSPRLHSINVHTISAPTAVSMTSSNLLSFGMGAAASQQRCLRDGLMSLSQNSNWNETLNLFKSFFPVLPVTSLGYKRLLHNLFELPEPETKVSGQPFIIPLSVSITEPSAASALSEDLIHQVWDLLPEEDEVVDLTDELVDSAPSAPAQESSVSSQVVIDRTVNI